MGTFEADCDGANGLTVSPEVIGFDEDMLEAIEKWRAKQPEQKTE